MSQPDTPFNIEFTTNPADFAACAVIMAATDPWITLGIAYEDCLKAFGGTFREVFLMKNETEIMGFVIMQPQGTFKGYIQTLAINKHYRGKGYGTQLLGFCQDRILTYSPNIFICVSSFNKGAIQLYKKFGFELIGELKDFIKPGFDELLLRKTVGPITGYQPKSAK
ncbi:GNAT family N-acetyltransferase [Mucilaginibacter gotjawali]|uniref:Ribosomal protein S18 acetylase RimI-like enzyme n=1 Tax=Mucilaginibacter gotjawali TaxID=1550579 RepID=A0A839SH01_9SPHI|nr:N-acetyltransferase [Mucilaginibacter gotjawali]MBB3056788.1 ribosomal protein S18 acetylase RimI-like enzyme [Mucilaginibacter gotjawali]